MNSTLNCESKIVSSFIVSLHDVCPLYQKQFDKWRSLLDRWGVQRRSLAVVPEYENNGKVSECKSLISALNQEVDQGGEVVLHGYSHQLTGLYRKMHHRLWDRFVTHRCGEFSLLNYTDARQLIAKGLSDLQPVIKEPIKGFTAPGWWQSQFVADALRDAGFLFFTSVFSIYSLLHSRSHQVPVLCGLPQEYGPIPRLLNLYNFRYLPFHSRSRPVFRIALHPYDLNNPIFVDSVKHLINSLRKTRLAVTYQDIAL